jgi:hypothetical protein
VKGFDWHSDPITSNTLITRSYRNTQNVRRFFLSQCGAHFKFDRSFMAWLKDGHHQDHGRRGRRMAAPKAGAAIRDRRVKIVRKLQWPSSGRPHAPLLRSGLGAIELLCHLPHRHGLSSGMLLYSAAFGIDWR